MQRRARRRRTAPVALGASALLTAALTGCGGETPEPPAAESPAAGPATLVLQNGRIATVDPGHGTVEALAVHGHTITAVGSNDQISPYIGTGTRVVELEGRLAVPGFIEGHGHFLTLGEARQILALGDTAGWDEVVSRVAAAVDRAQPGEWVLGRGWHQDKWNRVPDDAVDGLPRNDSLNAVSPENPVLLTHASAHAAFANDAALAAAGITPDTPNPPGGTIVRDPDGEATGLLRETAQDLADLALEAYRQRLTDEERDAILRRQVRLAGEEALRHGVTSFHDAGADFATIDFFRRLEAESALPVRLYVMVRDESNASMAERLGDYRMDAEGNDFLAVRSVKRQLDGALGSHGAWLLEPYADMPDSTGLVLEPVREIERTGALALEHGFQLNTHAIGTRANREVLDLYQRVWKDAGVDGASRRWRVEHAQHVHPDDVARFGDLGVIAAMQGAHCTSDGPWVPTRLGVERAQRTSYRWRDLIESGALIGNGTDVPVEPIDPIASYYASVSRLTDSGEAFHPEQAMSRGEALRSYTINNAYAAFEEDLKGSLTPGKLADIVVLSRDILTVPEADIPATEVDMTFLGGELRYAR